jgi:hypothetical protein
VVTATFRPLYPLERDTAPNVQGAGWAPGPVWKGAENLISTGIFLLYSLVLCTSSALVSLSWFVLHFCLFVFTYNTQHKHP